MSTKLSPKLRKPYQTIALSASPRGHWARRASAIDPWRMLAIARRTVAAQKGGSASFPIRMARNVLPQMSVMPANAPYWRSPLRSGDVECGGVVDSTISAVFMGGDRDIPGGGNERAPRLLVAPSSRLGRGSLFV